MLIMLKMLHVVKMVCHSVVFLLSHMIYCSALLYCCYSICDESKKDIVSSRTLYQISCSLISKTLRTFKSKSIALAFDT